MLDKLEEMNAEQQNAEWHIPRWSAELPGYILGAVAFVDPDRMETCLVPIYDYRSRKFAQSLRYFRVACTPWGTASTSDSHHDQTVRVIHQELRRVFSSRLVK